MATPRTVAFHTLGCKLNYSETSAIGRQFEDAGYGAVPFKDGADIYVINTCSVTDFADKKCRNVVRRALRKNEQAKVVVVGCYAQLKPQEIADIPGVDLVLGAAEKFRILDYIDDLSQAPGKGLVKAGEVQEAKRLYSCLQFWRSYAFFPQGPGWLRLQMHLLYHPSRAGQKPQQYRRKCRCQCARNC